MPDQPFNLDEALAPALGKVCSSCHKPVLPEGSTVRMCLPCVAIAMRSVTAFYLHEMQAADPTGPVIPMDLRYSTGSTTASE